MDIVVFGAAGAIGKSIATELVSRGHAVTGVTRSGSPSADGVKIVTADATDAAVVSSVVAGADAVVNAIGPRHDGTDDYSALSAVAHALIAGLPAAGVTRLIVSGGAGSLEVAPGVRLVDLPDFPAEYKPLALAHADSLEIYRGADALQWTYVSPAAEIQPGPRTGTFRIGGETLLADEAGDSKISIDDFAIAIADEVELPGGPGRRITAAY